MKVEIMYSTSCSITLEFVDTCDLASAYWRDTYKTLNEAITAVTHIFGHIYSKTCKKAIIWDTNTGEILATCYNNDDDDY